MRNLTIFTIILLISACKIELPQQQKTLTLTTINKNTITKKMQDMINEQNPGMNNAGNGRINSEIESAKTIVNTMKRLAERDCAYKKTEKKNEPGQPSDPTILSSPCDSGNFPGCDGMFDKKCLMAINNNQDIIAANERVAALENQINIVQQQRRAADKLMKQKAEEAIIEYAKLMQLKLVLDATDNRTIAYNATGVSTDATRAVLDYIEGKTWNLQLTPEHVSQLTEHQY